jgi:iron complex outermembrane recepter protein
VPNAEPIPAAEPTPVAAPPVEPASGQLEEMVVTADRREKNLQDYAGAATALSQKDLSRSGINSVRDISSATPYVEIGTQEGNTEVYIRGVGSDFNTELGDPAVATHLDGIYIPRPRGVGSMLFDIERLEISRGPQGTLRGRNASAGAMNIITAQPVLDEWLGEASFQLGNYAQRLGRGMVNVPISSQLALRLATYFENREPFFDNAGPIHTLRAAEDADTLAYRATLAWLPLKQVKATLRHDYTQEKGTGYTGANFASALRAGLLPEEVPNPRAVVYRGPQSSQDMTHWGVSGDVTIDLGPIQLGYLGGYRDLEYRQTSGGNDGVVYPGSGAPDLDNWSSSYWHTTSQSVVQELRLYAPDTARFRWTVGGFFFDESQAVFLGQAQDKSSDFAGTEFNMPNVDSDSYAGYVDATYDILDALRATAGARLTTESKSRDGIGHVYGFSGLTDTPFRFGTEGFSFAGLDRSDYALAGAPMAPFDDFRNGIANDGARDTLGDLLDAPGVSQWDALNEQHGSYRDTFVDFRLGSDIDITEQNLAYVMFSTGHQSGGFNDNIRIMGGGSIAPSYDPESIYATEIGSKNQFLEGKLTANVAAFWYHYANQQFKSIQRVAAGSGEDEEASSSVRFNAATSRVLGLEADVTGRLPLGLVAGVSAMLLDARITEGEVADTRVGFGADDQPVVSLEGKSLPRAPLLSLNYSIAQSFATEIGRFDWRLSAQTKTKQYMTVFNGEGRDAEGNINPLLSDVVPTFTRVDTNIGYTRPDGQLRLEAFVTNLTDVVYMTTIINTPGLNLRFFNPPRQVGVRLTVTL